MLVPVSPVLPQVGIVTSGLVTGSASSGVGMPIIGLTPKLLSSEDPSGIPTEVPRPVDDVPDGVPVVVDSIDVVPEGDAVVPQVPNAVVGIGSTDDVPFMAVVPPTPPPSKVERAKVVPANSEGDARTPGARALVHPELDVITEPGVVRPPGLSSTAPRGMPPGLRGEPTPERGEVIPIGGVIVLTCARHGPPNKRAIAMAIGKFGIATSLLFRIGATVVSCVQVRHA